MRPFNKTILSLLLLVLLIGACENKDLNEGEAFKPREIHENIAFNFDKITVDGIEYLILEKDNNNPHEGFGFMAFRANSLMEKQDTVLAYLKTVNEMQNQILAEITNRPIETVRKESEKLFLKNLSEEEVELEKLEETRLKSDNRENPVVE
ncbi:MAG: hypothetical protein ABJL71_16275 [Cyclobacteriaceae bacterium]